MNQHLTDRGIADSPLYVAKATLVYSSESSWCTIRQYHCFSICCLWYRVVHSGPVPQVPKGMSILMEGEFQIPTREFFDKIISSESVFFEEYHKARGDQRYRLTQWQRHTGLDSVVRCATFVSPVKAPGGFRVGLISPKETECNQNQRYRVYEGETLVFETSQVRIEK